MLATASTGYFSQSPPLSRKVLMPLSADMPAPVKNTNFFMLIRWTKNFTSCVLSMNAFSSVGYLAQDAQLFYSRSNVVQHLWRNLLQALGRSFSVDGVDHHLLGLNGLYCVEPRPYNILTCVVHALPFILSLHKHGLYDASYAKLLQFFNNLIHIIRAIWPVDVRDVCV